MTKKITAKNVKRNWFYKKESERTKNEKLFRAIVCFGVVIYTAVLGYMLINVNANLAEAEAALSDTQVQACIAQR